MSELDLEGHLVAWHVVFGVAQLEGSHEADEELLVLFVVHQLHLPLLHACAAPKKQNVNNVSPVCACGGACGVRAGQEEGTHL